MSIDWGKVRQKAVDIAVDSGKSFVREAERKTRNIEKAAERRAKQEGKVLSDKAYEKLDDMYDKIDNAYETMYDLEEKYHSRYKRIDEEDSYYEDDEYYDGYEDSFEDDVVGKLEADISRINLSEEELEEKIKSQIDSASKDYSFSEKDIREQEAKWKPLGKLSEIDITTISEDVAGLLKVKHNGRIVYIVRVIDVKSGGLRKKIMDIRNITNISNRKLRDNIRENYDDISVEILSVGKKSEDINVTRSLEKSMIKYYKPEWN